MEIDKCWYHDSEIQDKDGNTMALKYVQNNRIPPEQWIKNPNKQYGWKRETLAMIMLDKELDIPVYCYHRPEIKDYYGETMAYKLVNKRIIPQKQWIEDVNKQYGENNKTIAMILFCQNKEVPEYYYNNPEIQDGNGNTMAMHYARKGMLPEKQWYHKADIQNNDRNTVAMLLAQNEINIPKEWEHKSELQNYDGNTVAMIIAEQGKVVEKQWEHDPEIKNRDGQTVSEILKQKGIDAPEQWKTKIDKMDPEDKKIIEDYCKQYDINVDYNIKPEFQNNRDGKTIAMWLICQDKIPSKQWQHNPELHDKDGDTVALMLLYKNLIPPKEWCYDPDIKFKNYIDSLKEQFYEKSLIPPRYLINMSSNKDKVIQYFKDKQFPVPSENQETDPSIFDKAMLRQIPWLGNHKPQEQNDDGWTVAMILAFQGIDIPSQWEHDPRLKNYQNKTVQDYLIQNNLEVPYIWKIDQNKQLQIKQDNNKLSNQDKNYIKEYCKFYNLILNYNMKPSFQNKRNERTIAMQIAYEGIIPPRHFDHDPLLRSWLSKTVAMFLAQKGIIPPEQWQHKPEIEDCNGMTVAMYLVNKGIIPPKQWMYDPKLKNRNGMTIAMQIAKNCKQIPPQQWYHDPELQDKKGNTNNIKVPQQWLTYFNKICLNNKTESILYKYCEEYNIDTKYDNITPEFQNNKDKATVAMYLAKQKQDIPKQWRHNSLLTNIKGQTVAIIYAIEGIVPPKEWEHDPKLQDNNGNTVAIYLAYNKFVPPNQWHHNPELQNKNKETVAMFLAWDNGQIPPKEWEHRPELQDNDGMTVAMYLLYRGVVPPDQWYHDPNLKNIDGHTISWFFRWKKMKMPKKWQRTLFQ